MISTSVGTVGKGGYRTSGNPGLGWGGWEGLGFDFRGFGFEEGGRSAVDEEAEAMGENIAQ